ncbi:hypothetical protein, partial [Shewanella sp. T24-MNA-CIBAN-0130]
HHCSHDKNSDLNFYLYKEDLDDLSQWPLINTLYDRVKDQSITIVLPYDISDLSIEHRITLSWFAHHPSITIKKIDSSKQPNGKK